MRPGNWGTTRYGWSPTWPGGPARSWCSELAQNRRMDHRSGRRRGPPPGGRRGVAGRAHGAGVPRIIAVPNVGGYSLAVRAGSPEDEARLEELAADPDGPHYAVGQIDDVRELTSGWTDELKTLLQRCWPGPVEVFLPSGGSAGSGGSARSAGGPADAMQPNPRPQPIPTARRTRTRRPRPPTDDTASRTTVSPSTAPGPSSSACPMGGRCGASAGNRARGGRCPCASRTRGGRAGPSTPTTWRSSSTEADARARCPRWSTPR